MTLPSSSPSPAVVIDCSAWISYLESQDSNHVAARAWIDQHLWSGGLFAAPVLLVTETAAAISRGTRQSVIAQHAVNQLYSMQQMRLVHINQPLVDEATSLAINCNLRGADAYYVALAKTLGLALLTFDQEQLQRPAHLITTIQP